MNASHVSEAPLTACALCDREHDSAPLEPAATTRPLQGRPPGRCRASGRIGGRGRNDMTWRCASALQAALETSHRVDASCPTGGTGVPITSQRYLLHCLDEILNSVGGLPFGRGRPPRFA